MGGQGVKIIEREKMPSREEVYKLIDGERKYQDNVGGAKRVLPIEGEMILLRTYLQKAEKAYTETFGDPTELPTMDVIRKIAGICVRCMENNDTPERK